MPLKIFRRKGSQIWHYRGTIAGNRIRGSAGTESREIAARIAAEIESRHWKHRLNGPEDTLTFPKAVSLYLNAGKSERYIHKLEDHWKNTRIRDIAAGAIRQAAIDLYPGCSGATRNRCAIVPMQAIINHCAELGLCPPLKMKRFKVESEVKTPVTLDWLNAFISNATSSRVACLAMFMFATGARISEAMAVGWSDLDFQKRTVLIRQTKQGNERLAHLPMELVVRLGNLPRNAKPFSFGCYTSARTAWVETIERAGIEPLSFHCCRHGFATGLLHKGVDPHTIAKLGGWSSPQHVYSTYGHARDDKTLTDKLFDTGETRGIAKDG
jgi:integrase